MVVGILLILEGQTSEADVVQVLQPLEVGHGDTAGVDVQVGDDQNVTFQQDLVRVDRGRPVGSLSDDAALDFVGVALVDDAFHCARHQDVALLVEEVLALVFLCPGESHHSSVLLESSWRSLGHILNMNEPLVPN